MVERLSAARRLLEVLAPMEDRVNTLQSKLQSQLTQIEQDHKRAEALRKRMAFTFADNGLRRGAIFGFFATLLLIVHILVMCFAYEPDLWAIGFLWLIPLLVSILLWGLYFKGRGKRRRLLNPILEQLSILEGDENTRTRALWQAEINDLAEKKAQLLQQEGAALEFLPESCRSLAAVDYLIACFRDGVVTRLDAGVRLWNLVAENENLRHRLQEEEARKETLDALFAQDIDDLVDIYNLQGTIGGVAVVL